METQTYPYKTRLQHSLWSVSIYGTAAAFLFYKAWTNDADMYLRFLTLNPSDTSAFYGLLGCFFIFMLGVALLPRFRNQPGQHELVISPEGITAPKSALSKAIISIPFERVSELRHVRNGSLWMLHINAPNKKLVIFSSMLQSKTEFREIEKIMEEKTGLKSR